MSQDRYLELFLEEAGDYLEILNQSLLNLEKTGFDMETVQEIFRTAHTMKSSSAFVGLDHLSGAFHHMEDVIQNVRDSKHGVSTELITLFFRCLDRMKKAVSVLSTGTRPDDTFEDLIAELDSVSREMQKQKPAQTSDSGNGNQKPNGAAAKNGAEEHTDHLTPLELTEDEEDELRKAAVGLSVFNGLVRLDPDAPMKNLRFLLLVQNLKRSGHLFKSEPSESELETEITRSDMLFIFYGAMTRQELSHICRVDMVEEVVISPRYGISTGAGGNQGDETRVQTRNIKVSSDKIDYLLNNVGELVITNSGLLKIYEDLYEAIGEGGLLTELKSKIEQAARIARDLQAGIMKTRMIPIGLVFRRFTRPVRDLALDLGKDVDLNFAGEDTELDKNIIDALNEPLLHLLRNSLDHGIEGAEERSKSGKPEKASVTLNAYQSGNNIFVEVKDDGRGLDRTKILSRAISNGLAVAGQNYSDDDVYNFIFQPGFSTSENVTDISGRGVGMNVVKKMVQDFKGSIQVVNDYGRGCSFILSFPLTLAIISSIIARVAGEDYAFPLSDVVETIKISKNEITTLQGRDIINLRGEILPVFHLAGLMGMSINTDRLEYPVVIARSGTRKIGFIVDMMLNKSEIVIKSLDQNFRHVVGLIGACLMGDGRIVMVLDVQGILELAQREMNRDPSLRALDILNSMEGGAATPTRVFNSQVEKLSVSLLSKEKTLKPISVPVPAPKHLEDAPVREQPEESFLTHSEISQAIESPGISAQVSAQIQEAIQTSDVESALASIREEKHARAREAEKITFSSSSQDDLTDEDFSRIYAVINTGMINAGMVLSQLLGISVEVSVPEWKAVDKSQLLEYVPQSSIMSVFVSSTGEFVSTMILVFDEETGFRAAFDLMGIPMDERKPGRISKEDLSSVLSELANIVCASVLNSMANKTGLIIKPDVPDFTHGSASKFAEDVGVIMNRMKGGKILYISADFYRQDLQLIGRVFILPDRESMQRFLRKL